MKTQHGVTAPNTACLRHLPNPSHLQRCIMSLSTILPVVDPVLCSVDRILALVLPVVRTAVRTIADAIPAFLTKVLLVLDPILGVIHGVMSALDTSVEACCIGGLGDAKQHDHSTREYSRFSFHCMGTFATTTGFWSLG